MKCFVFAFLIKTTVLVFAIEFIVISLCLLAPRTRLDLGFIIGASGPQAEQIFAEQQQFIGDMLKSYTISNDATLAGIILNGITSSLPVKIGSAVTMDSFTRLLSGLENPRQFSGIGANGNLNDALQLARTSLFSVENGARRTVPKSLVVFRDNNQQLPDDSIGALGTEARALQDAGVKIIVIGIGASAKPVTLHNIFDAWFFPDDLPHMDDFVHPVVTYSLPGIYFF